jgi:hypothetical protein
MYAYLRRWRPYTTIIIYVIRICGLKNNLSMLVRIDIVFYRPQNRTPYIMMIVEAPPSEIGIDGVDARLS